MAFQIRRNGVTIGEGKTVEDALTSARDNMRGKLEIFDRDRENIRSDYWELEEAVKGIVR